VMRLEGAIAIAKNADPKKDIKIMNYPRAKIVIPVLCVAAGTIVFGVMRSIEPHYSLLEDTKKDMEEISIAQKNNESMRVIMQTPFIRNCKKILVLDKNQGRGKLIQKIANDFELTQAEAKSKLDSAEKNECNDDYQNFKANLFRQKVNPYFKYLGFNYSALLEGEQALLLDSEKLSWSWKNVKPKPTFP
jgi:hypothetical protein